MAEKIEKHLVAFVDILAFKSHVEKYFSDDKDKDELFFDKIRFVLDNLKNDYYKKILNPLDIGYTQFSDCGCISMKCSEDDNDFISNLFMFTLVLRRYQLIMLHNDLYIRGGLSLDLHYEDKTVKNMIFSKALIRSYKLESETAIYPRIILDDSLVEIMKNAFHNEKKDIKLYGIDKALLLDWEGVVFLNPFNLGHSLEKYYLSLNKSPYGTEKDTKKALMDQDKEEIFDVNDKVKKNIIKFNSEKKILKKYLWLQELIKWNQNPNSSKIKFEYFLK